MNTLNHKINTLTMEPADQTKLSHLVSSDLYRQIVNNYQRREDVLRPKCKTIFGLCRHFLFGKCTCKSYCSHQLKMV